MQHFASAEKGFWITQGVARALGLNLTDAMARGQLSRRGYAALVSRCETCPFPEDCTVWMSEQHGPDAAAPDYCPNKAVLDRLKREI